jgi:hypothetical protein
MNERHHTAWVVTLGAVVGGAVAYLFLTDGGRKLRATLEPRVADLVGKLEEWGAVDHLKKMAFFATSGAAPAAWDEDADTPRH